VINTDPIHPVVAIMGPTASGKTALAIKLAKAMNGEIISVDSALVYRGMDIGTAKPNCEEKDGITHHLIDILDPSEAYSTGRFCRETRELIHDIKKRGKLPILAGGTMLYFNALLNGLSTLPKADPLIRVELDQEAAIKGWHAMHEQLSVVDPTAAARIHPNDPQRIQRALEVFRITGKSITTHFEQTVATDSSIRPIRIMVMPNDRARLHQRIEERFHQMIDRGFIKEVELLYQRGDLHTRLPSIRAVGYRQIWDYLEGKTGMDATIQLGIIATRQFAKRQITWLRREVNVKEYDTDDPSLQRKVFDDLKESMHFLQ